MGDKLVRKVKRLERLLGVIRALETGRSRTVDDLMDFTGVSRRTVFRDLDLLSRAGIRYHFDRRDQRYSAEQQTLLPPVSLTHAETMALMMAVRQAVVSGVATDDSVVSSAALKLESMLPAMIRDYCGPLLDHVELKGHPTSDATSIRDTMASLQLALAHQRKVRIAYDSYYEGETIDVLIHPLRLVFMNRGWYLIALSTPPGKVLTFKVERVLRLQILEECHDGIDTFDLDEYFGNAWQMIRGDDAFHVKIRFSAKVAGNVDEIAWHKTQRTQYLTDGRLLFEVDVDGIEEISWWILGYGDQAEVLEPPELRCLIADRAARMVRVYEDDIVHVDAADGQTESGAIP